MKQSPKTGREGTVCPLLSVTGISCGQDFSFLQQPSIQQCFQLLSHGLSEAVASSTDVKLHRQAGSSSLTNGVLKSGLKTY